METAMKTIVLLVILTPFVSIGASWVGDYNKAAGNIIRGAIGILWGGGIIVGSFYGKENLLWFCRESGSDPQNASLFLNAGLMVGGILLIAGLYYSLNGGRSTAHKLVKTSGARNRFPSALVAAYDRWRGSRSADDLAAFVTNLRTNYEILPKGIVKGDVATALHERFPEAYTQPEYLKAVADLSRQDDSWTE